MKRQLLCDASCAHGDDVGECGGDDHSDGVHDVHDDREVAPQKPHADDDGDRDDDDGDVDDDRGGDVRGDDVRNDGVHNDDAGVSHKLVSRRSVDS